MDAVAVEVRLPGSLLRFWGGPPRVRVVGSTLLDVLRGLAGVEPGLDARVLDDAGRVRQHVGIFVNGRLVEGAPEGVPMREGDTVHVLPAVSGG